MSELLMPAGSIEKMKYAFAYGADAVYLGLVDFSLRALRKGELIDETNLKTAVDIANSLNKKVYCTLNIFAYDDDIKKLEGWPDSVKIMQNNWIDRSEGAILRFKVKGMDQNRIEEVEITLSEKAQIPDEEKETEKAEEASE